jgi:ubiquinone/menaquinone biosynthesis C-methylase UbiE
VGAANAQDQTAASVRANAEYFLNNIREYERHVQEIDTYARIHDFVTSKVRGVNRLLDVGNGGVFAYDTTGIGEITALDLFLEDLPDDLLQRYIPPNARARQGSALAIPEPDNQFDVVLMVMLLHHLAGRDWKASWHNSCTAMAEAVRVLKPGGRLLIIESCVPEWFFAFEQPTFWALTRMVRTVFSHPVTIQFPPGMIRGELARHCADVKQQKIPKGRYVLQFGFKVPSFATPAQVFAFEATKAA